VTPTLPLLCPACRRAGLVSRDDALVCSLPDCGAAHPVIDSVPILIDNWPAYAASERWIILRRRDLSPLADRLLESSPAEIVRAQTLAAYLEPEPPPELQNLASAFPDFLRNALARHARGADFALDLGCAAGGYTALLAGHARAAAGLDLHFERVRAAREAHPGLFFFVADAEKPPVAPGSVSLALWLNLLDSIARPRAALAGLLEILAPGAVVLFSSPFAFRTEVSEPGEWISEDEWDAFVRRHFEVLESHERLPWVLGQGPRQTDVFFVKAQALRLKGSFSRGS
jgi:SAM-dependent methyltransferase